MKTFYMILAIDLVAGACGVLLKLRGYREAGDIFLLISTVAFLVLFVGTIRRVYKKRN